MEAEFVDVHLFPDEMLLTIFLNLGLSLPDLLNVFSVCKRWEKISNLIFSRMLKLVNAETPKVVEDNLEGAKERLFEHLKEVARPVSSQALMKKLHAAIVARNPSKVHKLVTSGIDVNDKATYREYPLDLAAREIKSEYGPLSPEMRRIVHLLLSAGASESKVASINLSTPNFQEALQSFKDAPFSRQRSQILRGWELVQPKLTSLSKRGSVKTADVTSLLYTKAQAFEWTEIFIEGAPIFPKQTVYASKTVKDRLWFLIFANQKFNYYYIDISQKSLKTKKVAMVLAAEAVDIIMSPDPKKTTYFGGITSNDITIRREIIQHHPGRQFKLNGMVVERIASEILISRPADEVTFKIPWRSSELGEPTFQAFMGGQLILVVTPSALRLWKRV